MNSHFLLWKTWKSDPNLALPLDIWNTFFLWYFQFTSMESCPTCAPQFILISSHKFDWKLHPLRSTFGEKQRKSWKYPKNMKNRKWDTQWACAPVRKWGVAPWKTMSSAAQKRGFPAKKGFPKWSYENTFCMWLWGISIERWTRYVFKKGFTKHQPSGCARTRKTCGCLIAGVPNPIKYQWSLQTG